MVDGPRTALGKTPVEVNDYPGFVSNRVLMPMINEAIFAVYENVATAEAIDQVMKLGMNHPMGPLTLADFIGLDVCLAILNVLHDGLGDPKYRPCPLLKRMVDAGWLGRKSGRGFLQLLQRNSGLLSPAASSLSSAASARRSISLWPSAVRQLHLPQHVGPRQLELAALRQLRGIAAAVSLQSSGSEPLPADPQPTCSRSPVPCVNSSFGEVAPPPGRMRRRRTATSQAAATASCHTVDSLSVRPMSRKSGYGHLEVAVCSRARGP